MSSVKLNGWNCCDAKAGWVANLGRRAAAIAMGALTPFAVIAGLESPINLAHRAEGLSGFEGLERQTAELFSEKWRM